MTETRRRTRQRLQGKPTPDKPPLNPHRLHLIRLALLKSFWDPKTRDLQPEVGFNDFWNRANAYLWLELGQIYGITPDHMLYQLNWFEKRGMVQLVVGEIKVDDKGDPEIDPRTGAPKHKFSAISLNTELVDTFYGADATPGVILDHLETRAESHE